MSIDDATSDRWLELRVQLESEYAEPVTHLFSQYCDGRVFVEQLGDWDADDDFDGKDLNAAVIVCGYVPIDATTENRKAMVEVGVRLMAEFGEVGLLQERIVDASEWENQTFPSVKIGNRIFISPRLPGDVPTNRDSGLATDSMAPSQRDYVEVYLSPGLAFGTGNHPTTRLCLHRIVEEAESGRLDGKTVLDVGCGSGILSIVALKLGARGAWCIDIDDTAVRAVCDNLVMSSVSERAHVMLGTLPHFELQNMQFDFVFANITSRVLIELAEALMASVKPGGTILASGILVNQKDEVVSVFEKCETADLDEVSKDGDWLMLRILKSSTQSDGS